MAELDWKLIIELIGLLVIPIMIALFKLWSRIQANTDAISEIKTLLAIEKSNRDAMATSAHDVIRNDI